MQRLARAAVGRQQPGQRQQATQRQRREGKAAREGDDAQGQRRADEKVRQAQHGEANSAARGIQRTALRIDHADTQQSLARRSPAAARAFLRYEVDERDEKPDTAAPRAHPDEQVDQREAEQIADAADDRAIDDERRDAAPEAGDGREGGGVGRWRGKHSKRAPAAESTR